MWPEGGVLLPVVSFLSSLLEPRDKLTAAHRRRARLVALVNLSFLCMFGVLLSASLITGVYAHQRMRFISTMLFTTIAYTVGRGRHWLQTLRVEMWVFTTFGFFRSRSLYVNHDITSFVCSHLTMLVNSILSASIGFPPLETVLLGLYGVVGTFLMPLFIPGLQTGVLLEVILATITIELTVVGIVTVQHFNERVIEDNAAELEKARDEAVKATHIKAQFVATMVQCLSSL